MNFCKDCRHSAKSGPFLACYRSGEVSPVDGTQIGVHCSDERRAPFMICIPPGEPTDTGKCGNEGRYFQRKRD